MSDWTEVKAQLPRQPEDWSVWDEMFEQNGINGTVYTDNPPTISGYASPGQSTSRLEADLARLGATSVTLLAVPDTDWAESWKQFFKPTKIGERIVVCPSWEDYQASPGDLVVTLDPGQAFGTGDHPTTRGCLRLLESSDPAGQEIADIGCGSGILTVAALLLGAKSAVCVDVEAVCVEATSENLARNSVSAEVFEGLGFEPLPLEATYDTVLSNIISAAVIALAPEASRRVRPGGTWIVSGVIEQNWPDVLAKCEQVGFKLQEIQQEGDWIAAKFLR